MFLYAVVCMKGVTVTTDPLYHLLNNHAKTLVAMKRMAYEIKNKSNSAEFHIEASHLICRASRMTDFYKKCSLDVLNTPLNWQALKNLTGQKLIFQT